METIDELGDGRTVEESVVVAGRELSLIRPRSSEALFDQAAFEREEYLPYWADLWPSAVTLAEAVGARSLRGARTLELGCGLGLASVVAALSGGRVLATDWSPAATVFTRENARRNRAQLATAVCAWARPERLTDAAPWDLVIGSDLLYERRNVDQLLALLPRLVGERGEVWIGDPGRPPAADFLAAAEESWEIATRPRSARRTAYVHVMRPRKRRGSRLANCSP
jgi:predicted nicotinamide N-methyase